jgi:large subunit ribosomal protein L25
MAEYNLSLDGRVVTGKKLKDVRAAGLIPGVIYGREREPVLVQSEYIVTDKTLRGAGYHSPIEVTLGGKQQLVLVKNVDIDPVKRTIRNVEYLAVSADDVVEATTPIVIVNYEQSAAHTAKLSLMQVLEEIDVKAKPADLPQRLEVDATSLVDDDSKLTLSDIVLPKGVEFLDKDLVLDEQAVAIVIDPAVEAAEREAEAAAAATAAPTEAADVPAENGAKPEGEAAGSSEVTPAE